MNPVADILSGKSKGYNAQVYQGKHRLTTKDVKTSADFEACVNIIVEEMLTLIQEIEKHSERKVLRVTVGKSYILGSKKSKFSAENPNTWRFEGPASRWNVKYSKENYDGLFVTHCFVATDVPDALAAHKFDHQDLCLKYEEATAKALATSLPQNVKICNKDDGGGGRRAKSTIASALYLAFSFSLN